MSRSVTRAVKIGPVWLARLLGQAGLNSYMPKKCQAKMA